MMKLHVLVLTLFLSAPLVAEPVDPKLLHAAAVDPGRETNWPFVQLSSGKYVETLEGEAAKRHLQNLRARHPHAFRKAAKVLEERGWEDTGRVRVMRTNREAKLRIESHPGGPIFEAEQTYYDAEGEVTLWEWYDGNDENWEGNVHVLDYLTGTWINVDAQLWITEGLEWNQIWNEPIAGYEGPLTPEIILASAIPGPREIIPVTLRNHPYEGSAQLARAGEIDWWRIRRKWENYAWCVSFACGGGFFVCRVVRAIPEPRLLVGCVAEFCTIGGFGCLITLRDP